MRITSNLFKITDLYTPKHLIILGHSNIGSKIAQEGIRRGSNLFVTTRSENKRYKNLRFIETSTENMKKVNFWRLLGTELIPSSEHVTIVNTLGGSSVEPPFSLEDINYTIPMIAIEGLRQSFADNHKVKHFNVVQLSTLLAGQNTGTYPTLKESCDKELMLLDMPHLTILKMGHVVEPFFYNEMTQIPKDQHHFVAEQMALLPFFPLIGNKEHRSSVKIQTVDIDDIVKSVFNTSENSLKSPYTRNKINAVSHEILTQEEFFRFHSRLLGRKFRPVYIPIETAEQLVLHHSYGRFKDYVVKYCANNGIAVDSAPFKELLGREPKKLSESYLVGTPFDGIVLSIPYPPIVKYAKRVLTTLYQKPDSRMDTFKAVVKFAKSLLFNSHNFKGKTPLSSSEIDLRNIEMPIIVKIEKQKEIEENSRVTRDYLYKQLPQYDSVEEFARYCLPSYDEYINKMSPTIKELFGNNREKLKDRYDQFCKSRYFAYKQAGNSSRMI